ncbi:MAG TPA: putative N-acetylmannosamine-6-phosphate 2-epimerase [Candidatus Baltobacteraceae bacterium]|nr:putative N-acetylmannosamine-6-phosphate 2-epimerase [Candidatus Baltobacteraceae bacterium]
MSVLDRLRGGLIVSVQARAGSALDDPHVLAAMALCAQQNGAAGVRIQGAANLRAVRARVTVPIVGIVKREYDGFEPYITPTLREVREILECGAEIVALDATARPRPEGLSLPALVAAIQDGGALAMADCARAADGVAAAAAGAEIVATTLCGYTKETAGAALPALDLVRELRGLESFVICEGGIHSPDAARAARAAGADAVVVGTAITDTGWLVRQFVSSLAPQTSWPP